jgi:hypothetical protein
MAKLPPEQRKRAPRPDEGRPAKEIDIAVVERTLRELQR